MSPLRFLLAAGRLSSRRIRAGESARRLIHQSKNHADGAGGSGFSARLPMGGNKLRAGVAAAGALSSALIGAKLYLRKHRQQQPSESSSAWELTDKDAALEEVIAEEQDETKEAAMKARFEEWMVEYGRRYKGEEEKARDAVQGVQAPLQER